MVGGATVGRRKLYHSNGALKVVSTLKQFYVLILSEEPFYSASSIKHGMIILSSTTFFTNVRKSLKLLSTSLVCVSDLCEHMCI
jgi:hypothetical protein